MSDLPQRGEGVVEVLSKLHHALMNPLTVVVGYAQLLAARKDLDEEVRSQVGRILEEARECVRIMERMRQAVAPVGGGKAQPLRAGAAVKRRILVVDDEPVILKLAAEVLGAEFDVAGVPTAEEAQRRLLIEDFDLVLLDLNLEGKVGGRALFETLSVQQPEVAERVVFVTGGAIGEDERTFIAGSGRPYLQKPFQIKALRDTVRELVGG